MPSQHQIPTLCSLKFYLLLDGVGGVDLAVLPSPPILAVAHPAGESATFATVWDDPRRVRIAPSAVHLARTIAVSVDVQPESGTTR